jgi:predicted ribosomally synthesized peptide with SipW-like signal peptide
MGIVSIMAMAGMAAGATFAFFSSNRTSTGNAFSTGTLSLALTDNNETDQESVSASFGGTLAPGQCTIPQTLNLKNTGNIPADHAEVAITNVVNDVNSDANPDIDKFMTISLLKYDGVNVDSQIADTNDNGVKDLADWAASATALDNLALKDLNINHPLVMSVCLDSSAGNELQGDSVTTTFNVTLNQNVSQ